MNLYSWSCVALGNSNVSKNGASFIKTLTVALLPPCPSDTTIFWDKFWENSLPLKSGTFIESIDPLRLNAWLGILLSEENVIVLFFNKSVPVPGTDECKNCCIGADGYTATVPVKDK